MPILETFTAEVKKLADKLDLSQYIEDAVSQLELEIHSKRHQIAKEDYYRANKVYFKLFDNCITNRELFIAIRKESRETKEILSSRLIGFHNNDGYSDILFKKSPVKNVTAAYEIALPTDEHITDIIGGYHFVYFRTTNPNVLYTLGRNEYGQCGTGTTSAQTTIYKHTFDSPVKSVYCTVTWGYQESFAGVLLENGDWWVTGSHPLAAHGHQTITSGYTTKFVLANPDRKYKKVFGWGNYGHYLGETFDGDWYGWGHNTYGNIPSLSTSIIYNAEQITDEHTLSILRGCKNIFMRSIIPADLNSSSHYRTTYVCAADGKMYACGTNSGGALGVSTKATAYNVCNESSAVRVLEPIKDVNGEFVKDIVKITRFPCGATQVGLTENGDLYTWGAGLTGFGDDRPHGTISLPKKIDSDVENFWDDGFSHSAPIIYRKKDGTWKGWGPNRDALLGVKDNVYGTPITLELPKECDQATYGGRSRSSAPYGGLFIVSDGVSLYTSGSVSTTYRYGFRQTTRWTPVLKLKSFGE